MTVSADEKYNRRDRRGVVLRRSGGLLGCVVVMLSMVWLVHVYGRESAMGVGTKTTTEELELEPQAADDLERLGLTTRKPLRVIGANGKQVLHGRFLHITDMHPDPYYKPGSTPGESCHSGKGDAGKYGDAVLGCDSPMVLMEDTLKWVEENLKDKIDFVVWTGDNVRHDNDRKFPRTESNIFDMNQQVSDLMYKTFSKTNNKGSGPRGLAVPLVPSLGNNDVFPHNLFAPGPTLQTRELFKIWQNFVPSLQLHVFVRGAYFFQEIIPNQLAVLSINTLYLFQSNPLVDNCDKKKEPGYKLFEWLGYTLKEMRARNMKVWLTGHVPPNEKNYDISCLRKYVVWAYEYRDVIIGGLYGHMNMDHFITLDSVAAYKSIEKKFGKLGFSYEFEGEKDLLDEHHWSLDDDEDSDDEDWSLEDSYSAFDSPVFKDAFDEPMNFDNMDKVHIQGGVPNGKVDYMESVRENMYAKVKGKRRSGFAAERYTVSHVAASVVPTFNSGLRVWEYNTTGLAHLLASDKQPAFAPWDEFFLGVETLVNSTVDRDYDDEFITLDQQVDIFEKDKTFPPKKPKSKPLGPGYTPQLFTPQRYVQYYADLASINKGKKKFNYEIEYTTDDSVYAMSTLTTDEWIALARKLGKPIKDEKKHKKKHKKLKKLLKKLRKLEKLWEEYLKNSFVSSGYEDMNMG